MELKHFRIQQLPFRERLARPVSISWVVLFFALEALTIWLLWFQVIPEDYKVTIRNQNMERYLSSLCFYEIGERNSDQTGVNQPFNLPVTYAPIQVEVNAACSSASRKGELSIEHHYVWALFNQFLGEKEKAAEILEKSLPPQTNRAMIIQAFLKKEKIPEPLQQWANKQKQENLETWDLTYIRQSLNPAAIDPLIASGEFMYLKAEKAGRFFYLLILLGFVGMVCICLRPVWLQSNWKSPLPWRWQLTHLGRDLFLLFLISSWLSFIASRITQLVGYPIYSLLSSMIYLGVPAFFLAQVFTPGWGAACKLFRFRSDDLFEHLLRYLCLGFGCFFVIEIAQYGLYWVQIACGTLVIFDGLRIENIEPASHRMADLITGMVLAPLFEEVIYRGFIQHCLRPKVGVFWAIMFTNVLFATYHWYSLFGWISVFTTGVILSWFVHRTGSLWPAVIAHGLINLSISILNYGFFAFY